MKRAALVDSLILCKFLRGAFADVLAEGAEMLAAVTGFAVDRDEIETAGRRIVTLRKLFNLREGWTIDEDTLPPRFFDEALETATGTGVTLSREGLLRMIASYYAAHGWTDRGEVPAAQTTPSDGPGAGALSATTCAKGLAGCGALRW